MFVGTKLILGNLMQLSFFFLGLLYFLFNKILKPEGDPIVVKWKQI